MKINDFEYFLSQIYTPLKSIELLSNTIYKNYNEEWDFLPANREQAQELLSLTFAIKTCARYLLSERQNVVNQLYEK